MLGTMWPPIDFKPICTWIRVLRYSFDFRVILEDVRFVPAQSRTKSNFILIYCMTLIPVSVL
jgi:hypothetical protein